MAVEQGVGIGGHTEDRFIGTWTKGQGIAGGIGGAIGWSGCYLFGVGTEVLSLSWWLVGMAMLAGAIAGVILAQRWDGQTLLDRAFRRGLFLVRKLSGATALVPPVEGGAPTGTGGVTVFYHGRPIARPYRPGQQNGAADYAHAQ